MLERVHVENYKCLRDVTVDLGKLTILIGPNDSGKSSFLDVLQTLGKLVTSEFGEIFKGDKEFENLVWRREIDREILFEVSGETSGKHFDYRIKIPTGKRQHAEKLTTEKILVFDTSQVQSIKVGNQTINATFGRTLVASVVNQPNLGGAKNIREFANTLSSTIEFHFDPQQMVKPAVPRPNAPLSPTGDNLAGFLDALLSGPDRKAFRSLEDDLQTAIPTLRGISLPAVPEPTGGKSIHFVLAGDDDEPATIPASLASGGALLLTAFLALSYSKTPDLLLIEEPENGLHPSRLKLVVDVLRKMATGELGGRPRQIVLTTHSPLLLNYAAPDEVRVFVRDPEKGTQVTPMSKIPDADRLLKEFALGELWYMLGEEKMFQEQPA